MSCIVALSNKAITRVGNSREENEIEPTKLSLTKLLGNLKIGLQFKTTPSLLKNISVLTPLHTKESPIHLTLLNWCQEGDPLKENRAEAVYRIITLKNSLKNASTPLKLTLENLGLECLPDEYFETPEGIDLLKQIHYINLSGNPIKHLPSYCDSILKLTADSTTLSSRYPTTLFEEGVCYSFEVSSSTNDSYQVIRNVMPKNKTQSFIEDIVESFLSEAFETSDFEPLIAELIPYKFTKEEQTAILKKILTFKSSSDLSIHVVSNIVSALDLDPSFISDHVILNRITSIFEKMSIRSIRGVSDGICKVLFNKLFISELTFIRLKLKNTPFQSFKEKLDCFISHLIPPDDSFNEEFSKLTESQKEIAYRDAYASKNPYIYKPLSPPISSEQYSLNFMWINKNKISADQSFVLSDEECVLNRLINPLVKWALVNQEAPINFWIDQEMTTPIAVENTKELFKKNTEKSIYKNIFFKNIREIEVVKRNSEVFTDAIPIYFRVDLLKAVIADYMVQIDKTRQYCVVSDLDVEPLSKEALINQRSFDFLNQHGIVLARVKYPQHSCIENGFFMLNGQHTSMMESHRKILIDLSIEVVKEFLNRTPVEHPDSQQIYMSYPMMYLHHLCFNTPDSKALLDQYPDLKNHSQFDLTPFRVDNFYKRSRKDIENVAKLYGGIPSQPIIAPPSQFIEVPFQPEWL